MMLQIQNVSKVFRGLQALNDVTFSVQEKQIVGLIGPNGAGKTTLFNVISGFYQRSGGHVVYKGEDVTTLQPFQRCARGMARTFQIMRPLPYMSVLDNVIAGSMFGRHCSPNVAVAGPHALSILDFAGLLKKQNVLGQELGNADGKWR